MEEGLSVKVSVIKYSEVINVTALYDNTVQRDLNQTYAMTYCVVFLLTQRMAAGI